MSQWQPEHTAPLNKIVLVGYTGFENSEIIGRAIKIDTALGMQWLAIAHDVPADLVKCWMPLPEPPKDLSSIPDRCPLPDSEDIEKLKAKVQRLEHQNTQLRNHIERMRFDAGRRA